MKIGWVRLGNDNRGGLLNLWKPHVIWKDLVTCWQAWSGMRIRSLACSWRALVMWMDKGRRTFWSSTRKCTSKILRNISMNSVHEKTSPWFWSHRSGRYGGMVDGYEELMRIVMWSDRLGTCGRYTKSRLEAQGNKVRSFLILSIDEEMNNILYIIECI